MCFPLLLSGAIPHKQVFKGHIHQLTMCKAPAAMAAFWSAYIREQYATPWTSADQLLQIWLGSVIDFFSELEKAFWLPTLNYALVELMLFFFFNCSTSGLTNLLHWEQKTNIRTEGINTGRSIFMWLLFACELETCDYPSETHGIDDAASWHLLFSN